MDATVFKNVAEGLGALITAGGLLAAAAIFLWKREWRARVQLAVGVEAFRRVGKAFLLEPVCIVENKGLLRCYVHKLEMSVRFLRSGDELQTGDEALLFATKFPHRAVKVDFVKPEWEWSYVEAGIRLRYSHVTHVPDDTVAILVWAKLFHKKGIESDFFSAQKVLVVIDDQLQERRDWCTRGAAQPAAAADR